MSRSGCLMQDPDLVAACYTAMQGAADIPVTIKCRIGIDNEDSFTFLDKFVSTIADKGCQTFIIHARKAWLKGLSPKQNREVPPLDYDRVYLLKQKYPHLRIILNGGITQIPQIITARDAGLDGVMIGREAYQNPYFMAEIENQILGNRQAINRDDVARAMMPYIREQRELFDTPVKSITRHLMGLYHNQPGAKSWRRALSTLPYEVNADETVITAAMSEKDDAATPKTI